MAYVHGFSSDGEFNARMNGGRVDTFPTGRPGPGSQSPPELNGRLLAE